ncbi:MAG TPA: alpha/beta hydrolase [Ktedonobacterales bacterium]|nr:alpha/beta hydrolase [Ktedonobacterales bacterium]
MTKNASLENQSTTAARAQYTTGTVTSQDGTSIGYYQYGHGPGIVLVQGAMGSAQNFSHLAEALSDTFTVYAPDRRGRGLSPLPYRQDHTIQRDVEDLEALLVKTGTRHVFGLSSGAVIVLAAALSSKTIQKLAVFEPPLFETTPLPTAEVARFDRAMAQGNLGAALTAAGKAVQLVPIMNYIPGWLLTFMSNRMLASEAKRPKGDELTLRELTLSLPYDFRDIVEMHGALKRFSAIQTETLLLGGSKSPAYLTRDLDALEKVLPHVTRMEFPGLGHAASWDYDKQRNPTGNPETVARELRRFFAEA